MSKKITSDSKWIKYSVVSFGITVLIYVMSAIYSDSSDIINNQTASTTIRILVLVSILGALGSTVVSVIAAKKNKGSARIIPVCLVALSLVLSVYFLAGYEMLYGY